MCVSVYPVFITFYIAAQSGPVIVVILRYSHWSLNNNTKGGPMILATKASINHHTRHRGHSLSTCTGLSLLKRLSPCVFFLLIYISSSCNFILYTSWVDIYRTNTLTLSSTFFFSCRPSLARFLRRIYNSSGVSCASSSFPSSALPNPVMSPASRRVPGVLSPA